MSVTRFAHAVEVVAARGSGQDRACVLEVADGLVIALADGAGGTSNGAIAAQAIVDAVSAAAPTTCDWCELLADLDHDAQRLAYGQSTAVVLSISDVGIRGASVGDSGALMLHGTDVVDLTDGQARKPLVGSGCVPFRVTSTLVADGTLLVASDGLLRYAKRTDIVRIASGADLNAAARALIEVVRLANGNLQDDVAIVLCRELA